MGRSAEQPTDGDKVDEPAGGEPLVDETTAQSRRNGAIALAVVGFMIVVFLTTLLRLAENTNAG